MLDKIREELVLADLGKGVQKDILLVVHNELPYVQLAIESVLSHTKDYTLHIWDNGSDKPTADYLNKISENDLVRLYRSEDNKGFIIPNNEMAARCEAPYLILLNSDTKVYPYWDTAMIGWLKQYPEVAQVGYLGGYLDKMGKGVKFGFGGKIDYISGYCFCISRETYQQFGLFDAENLTFAYCEDSDFSMRLREAGKQIYSLYARLVHHYENKTIKNVLKKLDLREILLNNCTFIQKRWSFYLPKN